MTLRIKNNVQAWLLYCRYTRACTIKALAKDLGVNSQTIHYWINGSGKPSLKNVKKMEELSGHQFTKEMLRPDLF